MTKKLIALLLAAVMALALCACGEDEKPPRKENDEESEVLASGDNFEVLSVTNANGTKYEFTVTANDGSVMQHALCPEAPRVAQSAENVLGIRFTNGEKIFVRFFQLEEKLCSAAYFDAFWDNGELLGRHCSKNGEQYIQLVDIFEGDVVYEKALGLESLTLVISAAELSEDESELSVTYAGGESSREYTLKIDLSKITDTPEPTPTPTPTAKPATVKPAATPEPTEAPAASQPPASEEPEPAPADEGGEAEE